MSKLCEQCQQSFETPKYKPNQRFCSLQCSNIALRTGKKPANYIGRTEARCGHGGPPYSVKFPDCKICRRVSYFPHITYDDYMKAYKEQNSKCAICKKSEQCNGVHGEIKELAIDHDPASGKLRGLLCQSCNTGLGNFKDDVGILCYAIEYLEEFEGIL